MYTLGGSEYERFFIDYSDAWLGGNNNSNYVIVTRSEKVRLLGLNGENNQAATGRYEL